MGLFNGAKRAVPINIIHSDCVIDGHMHILSGYCTPLPLLWKPAPWDMSRDFANSQAGQWYIMKQIDKSELDRAKAIVLAQDPNDKEGEDAKTLQACSTHVVGTVAVLENRKAFGPEGILARSDGHRFAFDNLWQKDPAKKRDDFSGLFTLMIALPMDMEYAHIAGFEHKTIYHETDEKTFVFKRKSFYQEWDNLETEVLPVKKEDTKSFNKWKKQFYSHKKIAQNNPWSILPFYHYEPRRWYQNSQTEDKTITELPEMDYGAWDQPFNQIASRKQVGKPGIFIGLKMYPPLGYSPSDFKRLPQLFKYYKRCIAEDIPILSHCSLGGMTTHEYDFYVETEPDSERKKLWSRKIGKAAANPEMAYFQNACVHPRHWQKVLELPEIGGLRLCLAHFGGTLWGEQGVAHDWIQTIISLLRKYPNIYTDISCFDIQGNEENFIAMLKDPAYRDIHKKIIFGTDWYMILMKVARGIGIHYKDYAERFKDTLDKNKLGHLWPVMTLVNPVRYLGLENGVLLDNIQEYLKRNLAQEPALSHRFRRMKALGEEAKKIRDRVNQEWGDKDYLP